MHFKRVVVILTLTLILLGNGTSSAREIRQGDQCVIGANETIQGNLFTMCRTLVVNGTVEGNLIGAATLSEINGSITGDVYLLSGQLDLNGTIGGDLHFAGAVLRMLPTARFEGETSDLIGISLSTTLADGVTIPGSITDIGYQLVLNGNVGKEINFWGSALTLNGSAGENIDATVGDPQSGISQLQTLLIPFPWDVNLINPGLIVGKQSDIEGDLRYSGPTEGIIEGSVKGETLFTAVVTQPDLTQIIAEEEGGRRGLSIYLSQALREFVTLSIVGLIAVWVFSRPLQAQVKHIQSRPLPSMGVGLLSFIIAVPIVLIVAIFIVSIIFVLLVLQLDGLLLTLISGGLIGTLLSVVSVFIIIATFISRVVVCLWAGRILVRVSLGDDGSPRITYISLIVGIALLALLAPLPVVGWIINAIALFLGLGAIMIGAQSQFRAYRDVSPVMPLRVTTPLLPRRPETLRPFPPLLDDQSQPVGMENLPEGFTWWDD